MGQPGSMGSLLCLNADPKAGPPPYLPLRLLHALGTVKRQLCSVYRQLFLTPTSHSLSQGLRDRAQKLMR